MPQNTRKLTVLTLLLTLTACSQAPTQHTGGSSSMHPQAQGRIIDLVNTDKARYNPGDPVTIYVDLKNNLGNTFDGTVTLNFRSLGQQVAPDQVKTITGLGNGNSTYTSFTCDPAQCRLPGVFD